MVSRLAVALAQATVVCVVASGLTGELGDRHEASYQGRALGAVSGADNCTDWAINRGKGSIGWVDLRGRTCKEYRELQFCSSSGGVGPGWNTSWGTFGTVRSSDGLTAWMACCGCKTNALDAGGDGCDYYSQHPSHCGCCDDEDFTAQDLCMACASSRQAQTLTEYVSGWPSKTTQIAVTGTPLKGVLQADDWPNRFPRLKVISLLGQYGFSGQHGGRGDLTGTIPAALARLSELEELRVSVTRLSGTIPDELANLTKLRVLDLGSNELEGPIPPALARLAELRTLSLSVNWLNGTIPAELGRLTSLETLDLSANQLAGSIPKSLGALAALQSLSLDINRLSGTVPAELGNLTNLAVLHADGNKLQGTLPQELWGLVMMKDLSFNHNELEGTLAEQIKGLAQLRNLDLSATRLSGTVPAALAQLPQLESLVLDSTLLSGALPRELGQLAHLLELSARNCRLTGTVPPEWGRLTSLTKLDLSGNDLIGPLSPELGQLSRLKTLRLASNAINGTIPAELGQLSALTYLEMQDNLLEGLLPGELGNLAALLSLQLSNNRLSGSLPKSVLQLAQLQTLALAGNRFEGTLPQIGLINLRTLDVSNNPLLGGEFPDVSKASVLTQIDAGGCSFTSSAGMAQSVMRLAFSGNNFTALPSTWYQLGRLYTLDLTFNNIQRWPLDGVWPQDLFHDLSVGSVSCPLFEKLLDGLSSQTPLSWPFLEQLYLSGNPLGRGTSLWDLIYSLSRLPQLKELYIAGCSLVGSLPKAGAFAYTSAAADAFSGGPTPPAVGCNGVSDQLTRAAYTELRLLDMSNNSIQALGPPPPTSLAFAILTANAFAGDALHPQWYQVPQSLTVSLNPMLRVAVQAPSLTSSCPPQGSAVLQGNAHGWQDSELYECTSLCAGLHTRYSVDVSLNETSLCRCLSGTGGAGRNCTWCPVDTYSVAIDTDSMVRACQPCPAGSSTRGRTRGLGPVACACDAGWYMNLSMDSVIAGDTTTPSCLRCDQWPFQTTITVGAFGADQCQCNPDYTGLRTVQGVCGCLDGFFLNQTGTNCVPCTELQDCSWGADVARSLRPPSQKEYPTCPVGSYNAHNGSLACTLCDRGTFAPAKGSTACQSCPLGMTTEDAGSSGLGACVCVEGSYRPLPKAPGGEDELRCLPCPPGMYCPLGSSMRNLAKGAGAFPQATGAFMSRRDDPVRVFRCLGSAPCPGGPPGTCGELRDPEAVACGQCVAGSFEGAEGRCQPCGPRAGHQLVAAAAVLAALLAIAVVTMAVNREAAAQANATTACLIVVGVVFTSAQALSVFETMDVEWFEPIVSILRALKAVSFDLRWLRAGCLVGEEPILQFAPRQFIAPACLPVALAVLLAKRRWVRTTRVKRELVNTSGSLFSIFFISIVVSAAAPFICYAHPQGRASSMRSAPSVLCTFSGPHAQMVIAGVIALAVVPLPFFVLCVWGVLAYPRLVSGTSDDQAEALRAYRFLFFRYRPHAYYYAMPQLLRSLCICFVPVALEDPAVQVCVMGFVLQLFMLLQLKVQPWRGEVTNVIDGFASVMMMLLLLCTCLVTHLKAELMTMQVFGAVTFFSFVVAVSVYFAFHAYCHLQVHPYYHQFICHHKADAAAQARLLDLLIESKSGGRLRVFIDSDDLHELDELFDIVRCKVRHLVVYLTRFTMTRPWCAGEIVTAHLHARGVKVTRVETASFVPPTAAQMSSMDSYLDLGRFSLVQYHITAQDVATAYAVFLGEGTRCIKVAAGGGSHRFDKLVDHLVHGDSSVTIELRQNSSATWRTHPDALVLSCDPTSDEATAGARIFQLKAQHLLVGSVDHGVLNMSDHPEATPEAIVELIAQSRAVVVFLSKQSLRCSAQLAIIVEVMTLLSNHRPGPAAIPVTFPDFVFPGDTYYTMQLPHYWPGDTQEAAPLLEAFFKHIALPFATAASGRILDAQVEQIAERVPKTRTKRGTTCVEEAALVLNVLEVCDAN